MRYAVIAIFLFVAGCTPFSVVGPQRVSVKDAFTVEPDTAWNKINTQDITGRNRAEIWTADGPLLNSLTFFVGVEDGKPLFAQTEEQEKRGKLPVFRNTMTPTDIVELVEASYARITDSSLMKTQGLRPAKFAGADGFRFDMKYVSKDEVDREAIAAGTVHNGRLYLIVYQGSRLYHYGLRRSQVEHIIESARFLGG